MHNKAFFIHHITELSLSLYYFDCLYYRSDEQKIRNPYRWLPRREDQQKDDKKGVNASGAASTNKKRSDSPSQDVHIKEVTKDFCDWVESLGGESNNVEESTITSLFASGYETKPALSVPIHVVELSNVPPELRMSATVSQEETPTKTLEQVEKTQKELVRRRNNFAWNLYQTFESLKANSYPIVTPFKYTPITTLCLEHILVYCSFSLFSSPQQVVD